MTILIITPYIPFPLSEGGKASQYALVDYLRHKCNITLLLFSYSLLDDYNIDELKVLWPNVRIIIVDLKRQISHNFIGILKDGFKAILPFRFIKSLFIRNELDSVPEIEQANCINILQCKSKKLVSSISQFVSNNNFDIIQVDFIDFIDIGLILPESVKKIFVHHEIRFARLHSSLNKELNKFTTYENYVYNFVKMKEICMLNTYDAVFVFSDIDKIKLESSFLKPEVFVSPFPVLDRQFFPLNKNKIVINKLVFLGGENHPPNVDAVDWYYNEMADKIYEATKLVLHVVGNWGEITRKKYSRKKGILFAGYIDEINKYFDDAIMIVPVRIGSGIRTKILYAMAQGVPVISATIGCEGIKVENMESILIANNVEEFMHSILLLINNVTLKHKLTTNSLEIIKNHYSQENAGELRFNLYKKIIG